MGGGGVREVGAENVCVRWEFGVVGSLNVLWKNNFLYFYIVMGIQKLWVGDVASAWAVQLTNPQNFLPRCRWFGGDGRYFRKMTNILEIFVGGADSFNQSGTILMSSFIVYRRCFDTIITSKLADSVICVWSRSK